MSIRALIMIGTFALAAAPVPAAARDDPNIGTVTASIRTSQWGPDRVRLDLATGRYRIDAAGSRLGPVARPRQGRLDAAPLQRVREVIREAREGHSAHRACSRGGPPPTVVTNGPAGPIAVRLDGPDRDPGPPGERLCWTPGEMHLARVMDEIFGPIARSGRRPR